MRASRFMPETVLPAMERRGKGTGNVPSLVDGKLDGVASGEIFWFITQGEQRQRDAFVGISAGAGKRWQIVTYVEALAAGKATPSASPAPASASERWRR